MIQMSYIILLLFYACQIYLAEFASRVFKSFSVKYRLPRYRKKQRFFVPTEKPGLARSPPFPPPIKMEGAKRGKNFFDRNSRYRAGGYGYGSGGRRFRKNERRKYIRGLPFFAPPPFWREMAGRSVSQSFFFGLRGQTFWNSLLPPGPT